MRHAGLQLGLHGNRDMTLQRLASHLPAGFVRWLGRLQFRHPELGPPLRALATTVARGEGVIADGIGKGLRIDSGGLRAGFVLGTSDPHEQAWLAAHLKEGDAFYDLGANVGFFSLLAARLVGPSGTVVAFEPLLENYRFLERNFDLNGFSHATPVRAAVADHDGTVSFGQDEAQRDTTRIVKDGESARGAQVVSLVSIDSWRAQTSAKPPTVMKMDVEGAEVDALAGALSTIAEYRPTILVEVHWLGDAFTDFVEAKLAPLGYSVSLLQGGPVPTTADRFHAVLEPTPVAAVQAPA